MKVRSLPFINLAVAALLACPALVLALPLPSDTSSAYYTDTVNSYVQDQVSQDMEELNGFLCLLNAMAPDQLVNQGDYIAMVNPKACRPSTQQSSVNQGSNAATSYIAVQLNSSRESNTKPMLTKIWLEDFVDSSTTSTGGTTAGGGTTTSTTLDVPMYSSASQAPSKTLPYGVFRLDYCKKATTGPNTADPCAKRIGYIDANKSGLAFYTLDYKTGAYGEYLDEFALQLSANSSTNSGSGIVIKTNTNNASGSVNTSAIVFAHSPDYFFRDGGNNPQCFNRAEKYAEESVWRYGLYDKDGNRLTHESGFPVEYTDTSGVTYNGYVGYWGLWMPVPVATGSTLSKITYDTFPPTKKDYKLLQAGGKLTKYTTNFKTLTDLHKLPFWYYPYANVASSDTATYPGGAMTAYASYEIYWDDSVGAKKFFVYSQYKQNPVTLNWGLEKLSTPIPIDSASLVAADTYQWGLSGYADSIGGSFSVKYSDFASLVANTSATRVITQNQDVVYPKDFAAINAAGGLQCITDCPTVASISAYNADLALTTPTYTVSSLEFPSYNLSTYVPIAYATLINFSYSLDPISGNMLEGAPVSGGPVVQTTYNGVYSGRLVTGTDMAYIASQPPCTPSPCHSASEVDLLANQTGITSYSYYVWETSSNSYNQMGFLIDTSVTPAVTVKFYAPLPVTFNVPNTTHYGSAAGSTITLQYSDFGNLWGIPYKCVDLRNNGDCVYSAAITPATSGTSCLTTPSYDPACSTTITPWDKQYWTAQYSIPSGIDGVVTAAISQGDPAEPATYIAKNTQYLVKGLDKELRLAKVPMGICTVLGLDQPISVTKLPSADLWVDPIATIGTKPVLNPVPAPRVIHGVKQY